MTEKVSKNIPEFIKFGYGRIARLVMRSRHLSIEAKAIYSYLVSFAGDNYECYPKLKTITEELGISNRRYYKNIKQLIDLGLISTRKVRKGMRWDKTIYTIEIPELSQFEIVQNGTVQNAQLIVTSSLNSNSSSNINNKIYIDLCEIDDYVVQEYLRQYKKKYGKEHFRVSEEYERAIDNMITQLVDYDDEDIADVIEYHLANLPEGNNGSILYFASPGVLTRLFDNTEIYEWEE